MKGSHRREGAASLPVTQRVDVQDRTVDVDSWFGIAILVHSSDPEPQKLDQRRKRPLDVYSCPWLILRQTIAELSSREKKVVGG